MERTLRINPNIIAIGIPLLLMLSVVWLSQSSWFQKHPESFSTAITFDLALTIPLLYLLLIWKKPIPKTTAIPFLIGGLLIGGYILPAEHQFLLKQIWQWVVPVVELGALLFVGLQVRKIHQSYKVQKSGSFDFHTVIQQAAKEVLPKGADKAFAFEISVFYYGFINWKKRKLQDHEFSYHKKSGTVAVLAVLIGIVWIETFVTHILLEMWSPLAAWILTGLSLYTGFQLFGTLRSLSKRPISIEKDTLHLRFGIIGEACIPLGNIDQLAFSSKQFPQDEHIRKLSPLGDLENHNVLIHLKETATLQGLYGMKKKCRTIALHVDEKESFKKALEEAIRKGEQAA